MSLDVTLEELDLTVRTFNTLKRAGINTLSEIFNMLDKGISGAKCIRNLGKKSLEEVLRKAQERGYPADKIVEQHIAEYSDEDLKKSEFLQAWKALRDELRQIKPENLPEHLPEHEIHEGVPLASLEGMPYEYWKFLSQQSIVPVEELLNQYPNEENLLWSDHGKWQLLDILDRNGYRLSECTREQWPNIIDYIDYKRASSFSVEKLELPDDLEQTLKNAGITVLKIITESWEFLKEYLTNREIALLLYYLDEYNFRTKDAKKDEYPNLVDFITENIEISISDLGLSPRTHHSLRKHSIDTLAQLQSFSRKQLMENKIIGVTALRELTKVLKDNHVHLEGDTFYTCANCNIEFAAAVEPGDKHFCTDCTARLKRVKKIKDYVVTIDGPDYGSYTDETRGFTVFATVHNKTKKMLEVKLRDFMIFSNNRLWAPNSTLNGYSFMTGHIMPESSKTVAKIWSGSAWSNKWLANGDYVDFEIVINDKVYSYKFVMKSGKFEIDDYFVY